jgi:hypothetical protein
VAVAYEHSTNLPALLRQLELSVLLSTYQAGRVVSLGCHGGQMRVAFSHFDQAMGLCRTPTGVAVGSRNAVWTLPANREIAARIPPAGEHDIAFLARSAHHSGPLMGHDLAWCGDRLWLVNTLFNGLAVSEDGSAPAYVTALGETDTENGWREHKASGGCLIHVPSGEVVLHGLSMPHSPRLYRGQLYLLDSGRGALLRVDPLTGQRDTLIALPGFTRGLDIHGGVAFIGLSTIRETAVFGGLPLQGRHEELRCGLAIVDLSQGQLLGSFWFQSGVEEIFAVTVLPGYGNPVLIGPDTHTDHSQTVWLVPPVAHRDPARESAGGRSSGAGRSFSDPAG